MKALPKLLLLVSLFWSSTASTNPKSECDGLLDQCTIVVEQQFEALKDQSDVIQIKSQLIEHQAGRAEKAEKHKETATGIAIVEGILLLILLL